MPSAVAKNSTLATGDVLAPYDIDMSITDATKNMDKIYRMQVVEAADKFYFAMQWGRNGTKGQTQVKGPFRTEKDAAELMEKKFSDKTGNPWVERDNAATGSADSGQRKGRGHYELSARLDEAGAKKSKGKGSIAISLMWDHSTPHRRNDLDLWVTCPSGEMIGLDHKKSQCNGELDVDRRQGAPKPVENIVWTKNAPKGTYKIQVHNFSANHQHAIPFQVGIVLGGGDMEILHKRMPGLSRDMEKNNLVTVKTFTV